MQGHLRVPMQGKTLLQDAHLPGQGGDVDGGGRGLRVTIRHTTPIQLQPSMTNAPQLQLVTTHTTHTLQLQPQQVTTPTHHSTATATS